MNAHIPLAATQPQLDFIESLRCPDDMWAALNEQQDRRIALAAEHGLPLPEMER